MNFIDRINSDEGLLYLLFIAVFFLVLSIGGLIVEGIDKRSKQKARRQMATPNRH